MTSTAEQKAAIIVRRNTNWKKVKATLKTIINISINVFNIFSGTASASYSFFLYFHNTEN